MIDEDKAAKGSTFRATVDVTEWLGNESYAYIPFEAPDEVQGAARASSRRTSTARRCAPSSWSPSTAPARINEGDEAEIWVDTKKIHLFDPETGENLTIDRDNAGIVPGGTRGEPAEGPE